MSQHPLVQTPVDSHVLRTRVSRPKLIRRVKLCCVMLALSLGGLSSSVGAAELEWTGLGSPLFFDTAGNWNPGQAPTDADNLTFAIDVGGNLIILGAPSNGLNINFTDNDWTFTGGANARLDTEGTGTIDDVLATALANGAQVTFTGGAYWDNHESLVVGDLGYGTLNLELGNASSSTVARDIIIGNQAGSVGEINVDGAGTILDTDGDFLGYYIGQAGTGTLNVINGGQARITNDTTGAISDLRMGVEAGGHGTLNISGAGSEVIAEDSFVGAAGDGVLNITDGGVLRQNIATTPDAFIGLQTGSSGMAVVHGTDSLWQMARLEVGRLGVATLSVEAGGRVQSTSNDVVLGDDGTGSGRVAVFGNGASASRMEVTNDLIIGQIGLGQLYVGQDLNGTADGQGHLEVGNALQVGTDVSNTADNRLVVDGPGATVNVGGTLDVGLIGNGSFSAMNGATVTVGSTFGIGSGPEATGHAVIDGPGTTLTAPSLFLGNANSGTASTGSLVISDQARVTLTRLDAGGVVTLGDDPRGEGTVTVTGAGSLLQSTGTAPEWWIGGSSNDTAGKGTLNVLDGASAVAAGRTVISYGAAAEGTLNVDGAGSQFDTHGDFVLLGFLGAGKANVTDGGTLNANQMFVADGDSADGSKLTVDGIGSVVNIDGLLHVGDSGQGTAIVSGGGQLNVATAGTSARLVIGDETTADGSQLTVTGAGTQLNYAGTERISVGLNGGETNDRATLRVLDGAELTTANGGFMILGDQTGGHGQVIVDGVGSRVDVRFVRNGDGPSNASGIVDVTNEGVFTTTEHFEAGSNGDNAGTTNVTGAGSRLDVGGYLGLGNSSGATAALNVSDGGTVTTGGVGYVAGASGATATATISSGTGDLSSWSIAGDFTVAGTATTSITSGAGVLNIGAGGLVSVGDNLRVRDRGTINLNGGELSVGENLLLNADATFNFDSGTVRLARSTGYTVTENLLEPILGEDLTLNSGQTLAVNGVTVLGSPLRINGGTFSVGTISTNNFGNVDFDRGTFRLTNTGLVVGNAGLFGPLMVVDSQQAVEVPNGTTFINSGASLNVIGGEFRSAAAVNNGIIIVSQTDDVTFDSNGAGSALTNNGRLILVDATIGGMASGAGTIQVAGTSGVGGLSLSDPSRLEFQLSGTGTGQFDSLLVDGAAALNGTLAVDLSTTFTPGLGDSFELLTTTGSLTGTFDTLDLPTLGTGLAWAVNYGNQHAVLRVLSDTLAGDFNGDGNFDCLDVDSLVADIAAGAHTGSFDLTGDGIVDGADLTEWLAVAGAENLPSGNAYLVGDANLDGAVDGQDFLAWNNSKFTSTAAWCAGDFNADGTVDGVDFIAWNNNKFQNVADGQVAVPEPVGTAWGGLAAISLIWRRRHLGRR